MFLQVIRHTLKAILESLNFVILSKIFLFLLILQAIRLKYLHPDSELHNFALQVMEMLRVDTSADAQALVCFLTYLLL